MSVWGGLKNIVDTMNRGAHQDDWNKIAAQEEAIKSEQQRRLLATNADSRAAAGEGREGERFNREKSRYGIQDEADQLGLRTGRAGASKAEFDVLNQGSDRERRIKSEDAASARADKELALSGGRLSLAKQEALRMAGLTDAQIKAMTGQQLEAEATRPNRIEAENFNNSPEGRTERSMSRWGAILREMEDGPDKQDIIAFLKKQQGIPDEPEKPGWFSQFMSRPLAKNNVYHNYYGQDGEKK